MSLIARLTIRYFKKNKIRTFLTVIGVILSVTLLSSLANIILSANSIIVDDNIYAEGDYDFKITNTGLNTEKEIREIDELKDTYRLRSRSVINTKKNSGELKLDYYIGLDIVEAEFKFFNKYMDDKFIVEGRAPNRDGEILVPYDLKYTSPGFDRLGNTISLGITNTISNEDIGADKSPSGTHFSINEIRKLDGLEPLPDMLDKVDYGEENVDIEERFKEYFINIEQMNRLVEYSDTTKEYTIVGYHKELSSDDTYGIPFFKVNRANSGPFREKFLVFSNDVYVLNNNIDEEYNLYGVLKNYNSLNDVRDKVENIANKNHLKWEMNEQLIVSKDITHLSTTDFQMIVISLAMALVVVAVVLFIYNIFITNYVEKTRDLGLLKVLGFTNSQLIKLISLDTFIYFIIAIPIGFLFGHLLINIIYSHVNRIILESTLVNEISLQVNNKLGILIFSSTIGLIAIFLSNLLSAFFVLTRTPIDALKGKIIKTKETKNSSRKIINKLFGLEGFIAYRNILRNPTRFWISTFSITISIVLFSLITSLSGFLDYSTFSNVEKNIDTNLRIETVDSLSQSFQTDIERLRGVDIKYKASLLDTYINMDSLLDDNEKLDVYDYNWTIMVYDDSTYKKYFNTPIDVSHIVINMYHEENKPYERLYKSKINKVEMADIVPIKIGNNNEIEQIEKDKFKEKLKYIESDELLFDGSEVYSKLMIVSKTSFDILRENIEYEEDQIRIAYGLDRTDLSDQFGQELNAIMMKYPRTYQNDTPYEMFRITRIFIFSFIVILAFIGSINIYNTVYADILVRQKENALLMVVGLEQKRMKKIVRFENIISSFISIIISLVLVIVFIYYITFKRMDLSAEYLNMNTNIFTLGLLTWAAASISTIVIVVISVFIPMRSMFKYNIIDDLK